MVKNESATKESEYKVLMVQDRCKLEENHIHKQSSAESHVVQVHSKPRTIQDWQLWLKEIYKAEHVQIMGKKKPKSRKARKRLR